MTVFTNSVRSCSSSSAYIVAALAGAVFFAFVPPGLAENAGGKAADSSVTNAVLTAADVQEWDLDRCRVELDALQMVVRRMPTDITAARAATAEARRTALSDPQLKVLIEEVARLSQELKAKQEELTKAMENAPAVQQALRKEADLNAQLESTHKSIAVARQQLRMRLAERDSEKTTSAPEVNP